MKTRPTIILLFGSYVSSDTRVGCRCNFYFRKLYHMYYVLYYKCYIPVLLTIVSTFFFIHFFISPFFIDNFDFIFYRDSGYWGVLPQKPKLKSSAIHERHPDYSLRYFLCVFHTVHANFVTNYVLSPMYLIGVVPTIFHYRYQSRTVLSKRLVLKSGLPNGLIG